jgi:hypothetical protein
MGKGRFLSKASLDKTKENAKKSRSEKTQKMKWALFLNFPLRLVYAGVYRGSLEKTSKFVSFSLKRGFSLGKNKSIKVWFGVRAPRTKLSCL